MTEPRRKPDGTELEEANRRLAEAVESAIRILRTAAEDIDRELQHAKNLGFEDPNGIYTQQGVADMTYMILNVALRNLRFDLVIKYAVQAEVAKDRFVEVSHD